MVVGRGLCVVMALVVLSITGLDAKQRRAGLWLKGDAQSFPVDWTFADKYQTIMIETHPWYLIPHSVTTGFIVHDGQLYLTSMFAAGMPFPQGKSWVTNVMRDPHVRLKLGNNLYDCVLSPVTDSEERAAGIQYCRIISPMIVPGPTRVRSWPSVALDMPVLPLLAFAAPKLPCGIAAALDLLALCK